MADVETRERAVLDLLDSWPWETGGVVIGGYAVIAYGPPRYSDDLDVVIPNASARAVRSWLLGEGFELEKHSVPNPQNFEGEVERYVLDEIKLDLLAGAVRDRDAKIDVPAEWISKRPRKMVLETLSGKTSRPVPIARIEALWALKLQAGRDTDLTDLFAISDLDADLAEVVQIFTELATDTLTAKLKRVLAKLSERKLYVDSLSRRQLGSPNHPPNIRRWQRFVSRVETIVLPLTDGR